MISTRLHAWDKGLWSLYKDDVCEQCITSIVGTESVTIEMCKQNLKEIVLLRRQVEILQARIWTLERERREHRLMGSSSHVPIPWTCPMCTYLNPASSMLCDICDETKPSSVFRRQDVVCDC